MKTNLSESKSSNGDIAGLKPEFLGKETLIRKRKSQPSQPSKPDYFLIYPSDRKYISSLYRIGNSNRYRLEYLKKHYIFDSETLKIIPDTRNSDSEFKQSTGSEN